MPDAVAALRRRLVAEVATYESAAVALSGGVDSAVVAAAAFDALGSRAIAITAQSPSVAMRERDDAAATAARIGIRHIILATDEFAVADYRANAGDRCLHCKRTLYAEMAAWTETNGFAALVSGTNADDLGDYRPGLRAAGEFAVRSPLADLGIGKADVRRLAAAWDLPLAEKPASPCLSSRLAVGVEATVERVARIEAAESLVRTLIGDVPLRVRTEANELARIEVPPEAIAAVVANRTRLATELRSLGFRAVTVDLEGFRSGSLNDLVPLTVRQANERPADTAGR